MAWPLRLNLRLSESQNYPRDSPEHPIRNAARAHRNDSLEKPVAIYQYRDGADDAQYSASKPYEANCHGDAAHSLGCVRCHAQYLFSAHQANAVPQMVSWSMLFWPTYSGG